MPAYTTQVDIINGAMQYCRRDHITKITDQSEEAHEASFAYDKVRLAELRRNVWAFAVRRAVLRPISTTTVLWTPPDYASGTTYSVGQVVVSGGEWWASVASSNTGHTPGDTTGAYWQHYYGNDSAEDYDSTLSYFTGELVVGSDSKVYLSKVNSNSANDPTTDAGVHWLLVNGTTATLEVLYPIGVGPRTDVTTDNYFRLPHGYLRQAPDDPRASVNPYLGAPYGPYARDFLFENNYIVSSETIAILLRYVADVTDVTLFDPMFCDGFAASLAKRLSTVLVTDKDIRLGLMTDVERDYNKVMREARLVNGIETGPTEPDEDDLITCRY